MKYRERRDLECLTNYIFEHEFEDYCETLQETLPEAEAEKIEGYIKAGDMPALEAFAYRTGDDEVQHIYAVACRVNKNYLC